MTNYSIIFCVFLSLFTKNYAIDSVEEDEVIEALVGDQVALECKIPDIQPNITVSYQNLSV